MTPAMFVLVFGLGMLALLALTVFFGRRPYRFLAARWRFTGGPQAAALLSMAIGFVPAWLALGLLVFIGRLLAKAVH